MTGEAWGANLGAIFAGTAAAIEAFRARRETRRTRRSIREGVPAVAATLRDAVTGALPATETDLHELLKQVLTNLDRLDVAVQELRTDTKGSLGQLTRELSEVRGSLNRHIEVHVAAAMNGRSRGHGSI